MAKAKSIAAADLAKFTSAAVKAATGGRGRLVKGPIIWGFILQDVGGGLDLATQVAQGVSANARAAGISGVRVKPSVVFKPGRITAGFILRELNIPVR